MSSPESKPGKKSPRGSSFERTHSPQAPKQFQSGRALTVAELREQGSRMAKTGAAVANVYGGKIGIPSAKKTAQICEIKVGEKLVHARKGVVEFLGTEEKVIDGKSEPFCVFRLPDNKSRIMIPAKQVEESELRRMMDAERIKGVFALLRGPTVPWTGTWNVRYKYFRAKMNTGEIDDVAEIARDLYREKNIRKLGPGDVELLENAMNMLVAEISLSRNQPEELVRAELQAAILT